MVKDVIVSQMIDELSRHDIDIFFIDPDTYLYISIKEYNEVHNNCDQRSNCGLQGWIFFVKFHVEFLSKEVEIFEFLRKVKVCENCV